MNSKVTWYSSSIQVEAQPYFWDGNGGCRADKIPAGLYPKGTNVVINGPNNICMVKYIFTNKNKDSDLRVQIYRDMPPDAAKTLMWSTLAVLGAVAAALF